MQIFAASQLLLLFLHTAMLTNIATGGIHSRNDLRAGVTVSTILTYCNTAKHSSIAQRQDTGYKQDWDQRKGLRTKRKAHFHYRAGQREQLFHKHNTRKPTPLSTQNTSFREAASYYFNNTTPTTSRSKAHIWNKFKKILRSTASHSINGAKTIKEKPTEVTSEVAPKYTGTTKFSLLEIRSISSAENTDDSNSTESMNISPMSTETTTTQPYAAPAQTETIATETATIRTTNTEYLTHIETATNQTTNTEYLKIPEMTTNLATNTDYVTHTDPPTVETTHQTTTSSHITTHQTTTASHITTHQTTTASHTTTQHTTTESNTTHHIHHDNTTSATLTAVVTSTTEKIKHKFLGWILHPHIARKHMMHREVEDKFFMAVLVVADKSFMDYHKSTDYDTYILTVMNMAADYIHDVTLGINLELVVVRTIYLEEDNGFECCKNDSRLKRFCEWVDKISPIDRKHPYYHDVAILVTRWMSDTEEDSCGATGAPFIGGACVSGRSCALAHDTGLELGANIAHQIGHLLSAPHDEPSSPDSAINSTDPAPFAYVMSPTLQHGSLVWSNLSRQNVVAFFKDGHAHCLMDEPPTTLLTFPGILPGVTYDADRQCNLLMHGSRACYLNPTEFCSKLFCRLDTSTCFSNSERPAQGTPCGYNKWCWNGACVHRGWRPLAVSGGWAAWGDWSPCSRTCGGGVQRAARACSAPPPHAGGRYCAGDAVRYRTCRIQACKPGEPSFRASQCSLYDDVLIAEERHRWRPLAALPADPCGLYCTSDAGVKVRLRPRAVDGTPCQGGANDLCIQGVCTKVGCDWLIGSKASEDRCGICGGDGSHCHLVEGRYNITDTRDYGYKLMTVVPKDSRKVKVFDAVSSVNNLAIANVTLSKEKEHFFLVGNKRADENIEFQIEKIMGVYTHVEKGKDMILINGPLPIDIRIYLIPEGDVGSVQYSYMDIHTIERVEAQNTSRATRKQRNAFSSKARAHWGRYQWEYLEWGRCSARCQMGVAIIVPHCVSVWFGRVSDSHCDASSRPDHKSRVCNEQPCRVRWRTGPWSMCRDGIQVRKVRCVREARSYASAHTIVDSRHCPNRPPPTKTACHLGSMSTDNDNNIFQLDKVVPTTKTHATGYYIDILDSKKRAPQLGYFKNVLPTSTAKKETTVSAKSSMLSSSIRTEASASRNTKEYHNQPSGAYIEPKMFTIQNKVASILSSIFHTEASTSSIIKEDSNQTTGALIEPKILTIQNKLDSPTCETYNTTTHNTNISEDSNIDSNDNDKYLDIKDYPNSPESSEVKMVSVDKELDVTIETSAFEATTQKAMSFNDVSPKHDYSNINSKHKRDVMGVVNDNIGLIILGIAKNSPEQVDPCLHICLSKDSINELNKMFDNTGNITLIFKDSSAHIFNDRPSPGIISTGLEDKNGNKIYDFDDIVQSDLTKNISSILECRHTFKTKSTNSHEFVTKIPLKLMNTIVPLQELRNQFLHKYHHKTLSTGVFDDTTGSVLQTPTEISPSTAKAEHNMLTSDVPSGNLNKYFHERKIGNNSKTICLDLKDTGITMQSLYNIININCYNCNQSNLNTSNSKPTTSPLAEGCPKYDNSTASDEDEEMENDDENTHLLEITVRPITTVKTILMHPRKHRRWFKTTINTFNQTNLNTSYDKHAIKHVDEENLKSPHITTKHCKTEPKLGNHSVHNTNTRFIETTLKPNITDIPVLKRSRKRIRWFKTKRNTSSNITTRLNNHHRRFKRSVFPGWKTKNKSSHTIQKLSKASLLKTPSIIDQDKISTRYQPKTVTPERRKQSDSTSIKYNSILQESIKKSIFNAKKTIQLRELINSSVRKYDPNKTTLPQDNNIRNCSNDVRTKVLMHNLIPNLKKIKGLRKQKNIVFHEKIPVFGAKDFINNLTDHSNREVGDEIPTLNFGTMKLFES